MLCTYKRYVVDMYIRTYYVPMMRKTLWQNCYYKSLHKGKIHYRFGEANYIGELHTYVYMCGHRFKKITRYSPTIRNFSTAPPGLYITLLHYNTTYVCLHLNISSEGQCLYIHIHICMCIRTYIHIHVLLC